jgi:hypothetical protein
MRGRPSTAADDRITFVLPLRGARDTLAARLNLFPSIDRFFDVDDIDEVMVVTRPEEMEALVLNDVVSPRLRERIRRYCEDDFLPRNKSLFPLRGYDRQQVIKVTACNRIHTRVYCTLDSDMYLVRPCRLADWLIDGKCVYNPCSMDTHLRWWKASARHLGYELDSVQARGFDVTPALVYTDIMRELAHYLETERKGISHAIRNRATEHCLYWLYLLKNHNRSELYHEGPPYLYGRCLWTPDDAEPNGVYEFIDRQFSSDGYFFSILQSTSGFADRGVLEYVHSKIVQSRGAVQRSRT